jgi:MFS family permease
VVNTMTVETQVTSHVRLPREVRILVGARVIDRLGGFTLTFLPLLLVTAYGASLRVGGLMAGAFGLATIPSRLLGGRLSDRLGRRTTIVLGLSGCAVAQLTLAVAPGLRVAFVAAVLLGLCFEIYEPPSQALLADLTPPPLRVAAYSALGAAIAAAGVVAGLLAALLAGVGLRWLFVADAATCLTCAAVVLLRLPAGHARAPRGHPSVSPWRDRRLRLMLGTGTGFATLYMTMMCGLPLALHHEGLSPRWAGVLVALSAATVIVGRRLPVSGHADPFLRMRTGYAVLGLGLLLAAAATAVGSDGWSYVGPVVVWSLGDAVLLGEPLAVVAGLAPAGDRGRYLAAYGVGWGVATTLAPALATGLLLLGGSPILWSGCATASLTLAGVQRRVGAAVSEK